jgi:hypothetical protein
MVVKLNGCDGKSSSRWPGREGLHVVVHVVAMGRDSELTFPACYSQLGIDSSLDAGLAGAITAFQDVPSVPWVLDGRNGLPILTLQS